METKFVRSTPYEDYSFQLLIKGTDLSNGNPAEFNIDFIGDAEIEINTIQLQFSTDPAYIRFEVQSPELQFDYGNSRYLQITYPFAAHNLQAGMVRYKFHSYLNGKININIIDPATKALPSNFTEMVLSGRIRRM